MIYWSRIFINEQASREDAREEKVQTRIPTISKLFLEARANFKLNYKIFGPVTDLLKGP